MSIARQSDYCLNAVSSICCGFSIRLAFDLLWTCCRLVVDVLVPVCRNESTAYLQRVQLLSISRRFALSSSMFRRCCTTNRKTKAQDVFYVGKPATNKTNGVCALTGRDETESTLPGPQTATLVRLLTAYFQPVDATCFDARNAEQTAAGQTSALRRGVRSNVNAAAATCTLTCANLMRHKMR